MYLLCYGMKIPSKHHKHFLNKVCTVFTNQINRNFKEENPTDYPKQLYNYFVGFVEDMDEAGILIRQVATGLRTYLCMHNVVAVAEEQVEMLSQEDVDRIVKEEPGYSVPDVPTKPDDPCVNIEGLSQLAKQAQNTFDKKPASWNY